MNCSTSGLPVHHHLPEFTQTRVHRVRDAIQPSHPLSSPSPPAPNPSQHQSLFQWVNSSHEVAKVLELSALASFLPKKSQSYSFQRNPRVDLLQNGLVGSPCIVIMHWCFSFWLTSLCIIGFSLIHLIRIYSNVFFFSSVQLLSCVRFFVTPWIAAHQASLSITNSQSSLRFTSIESVMSSSHLILCWPLLLLPPIPPSSRVFSNESTLHMRWPKYWSFSFSIIPSKEIPGLISFRMDWLDLLALL